MLSSTDRLLFRRVILLALATFLLTAALKTEAAPPEGTAGEEAGWQVTIRPSGLRAAAALDTAAGVAEPAPLEVPQEVPQVEQYEPVVESSKPYDSTVGASTTRFVDEDWTVTIIPRAPRGTTVNGMSYEEVYRSIPYKKESYYANPGYRHEATMEVLFGQLRPKTVVTQSQPERIPEPTYSSYRPYRFYSQRELNWGYRQGFPSLYGWGLPLYPRYPNYSQLW